MRIKRNVRYTSRSAHSKIVEKSPASDFNTEVIDDAWDIFKENVDNCFTKQCFTSYLIENLSGIRQEVSPSPHPRRTCPVTIEDFEE